MMTSTVTTEQPDMLLVTLPWWDLYVPHAAPAVIKGVAASHGFNVVTYDSSLDLYEIVSNKNMEKYIEFRDYFTNSYASKNSEVESLYQIIIDKIKKVNPKCLGISVFSVYTHKATLDLCSLVRKNFPDLKIVAGGSGLSAIGSVSIADIITPAEKLLTFDLLLRKRRLIDTAILGSGEDAIIEFLSSGNPGEEIKVEVNDKLYYPFPDFDDTKIFNYLTRGNGKYQLPIASSQGCVRSCDFCDIPSQYKFKSKDGIRLAEELIFLKEKYGEKIEFGFADSVLNGNIKELKRMCQVLSEYNSSKTEERKVKWSGNWICRPEGTFKEEFYNLIATAGGKHFTVGVEHGSNNVLEIMRKKTTVEGLYYDLEMFKKYDIVTTLNIMHGHWGEQYDDFVEQLKTLVRLGPYIASRTVSEISLSVAALLQGTFASDPKNFHITGLVSEDENFTNLWYTKNNPNLTLKTRLVRFMIYMYVFSKMNITLSYGKIPTVMSYNHILETESHRINEYFNNVVDKKLYTTCKSYEMLNDPDSLVSSLISEENKTATVHLTVKSESVNGSPNFIVRHNGKTLYDNVLSDGIHELLFEVENDFSARNFLELESTNIGTNDTLTDDLGNIVKDKSIKFLNISVSGVDIKKEMQYYYYETEYFLNGKKQDIAMDGLYAPAMLRIGYEAPLLLDVLTHARNFSINGYENSKNLTLELKRLRKNIEKLDI